MSRFAQQEQLLARLSQSLEADNRGFAAAAEPPAGVLILYHGHCRGIWHCKAGAFAYTPGGYAAPTYQAASVQEAVAYTLESVCRQAAALRTGPRSGLSH